MNKITCWLKVRTRHNIDSVLRCLNFWLGAFDDKNKYEIIIYSEDLDLPPDYHVHRILRKHDLLANPGCRKIFNQIHKNGIAPHWRGAAFALSAPYFYPTNGDIIYNIDADDISIYGPIKTYLSSLENTMVHDPKIFTLSYDMHYSWHQGDYATFRPHHWTFGINLSKKEEMKEHIAQIMFKDFPRPPWGTNIDYMMDKHLDTVDTPYVCFITPSQMIHYISGDYNQNKCVKLIKTANQVETRLYGRTMMVNKHPRTLVVG